MSKLSQVMSNSSSTPLNVTDFGKFAHVVKLKFQNGFDESNTDYSEWSDYYLDLSFDVSRDPPYLLSFRLYPGDGKDLTVYGLANGRVGLISDQILSFHPTEGLPIFVHCTSKTSFKALKRLLSNAVLAASIGCEDVTTPVDDTIQRSASGDVLIATLKKFHEKDKLGPLSAVYPSVAAHHAEPKSTIVPEGIAALPIASPLAAPASLRQTLSDSGPAGGMARDTIAEMLCWRLTWRHLPLNLVLFPTVLFLVGMHFIARKWCEVSLYLTREWLILPLMRITVHVQSLLWGALGLHECVEAIAVWLLEGAMEGMKRVLCGVCG